MQEKYKKIGKIILIVVVSLIILAVAGSFVMSLNRSKLESLSFGGYSGGSDFASKGIGLGSVMNRTQKSSSPAMYESDSEESARQDYQAGEFTLKKIIKNGSLTLYVKDAEIAAKDIQALAIDLEGFVAESNIYQSSSGIKSGSVTIRIPVKYFESAMNNVKQLAEEVERENVSAQDVTEEYIDLEAQIRNLRAEEAQYLEIMHKSFTINETLQVANRLSDVRGRIERAQGRLKYLSRQVDMSTIRITLEADADVKVFGLRWRPLIVTKRALKDMFSGLADYLDAMIMIIFKLPVIIVWLATTIFGLALCWRLFRWVYRKFFKRD